ncbi:hypothetical protein Cni_G08012 [Canna indica]|uniref:TF-B3 domain-containing protein n=1 Tax=Canna indica TaxID=4628 RepID=A0AAQ3Q5C2_9LILI|nr:hypothetical protein Cni_G08012 [Canna indica]
MRGARPRVRKRTRSPTSACERIPPKFKKYISNAGSKRVIILQGPSGSNWRVQLGRQATDIFLTKGWPKFVKDHSLKEHEFLVFQYDGDMHFTVLIFDTTACEREDAFTVRPWRKRTPSQGGTGKRGRPRKGAVSAVKKEVADEHGLSLELIKVKQEEDYETKPFQILPSDAGRCLISPAPGCNIKVKVEQCELPISRIYRKPDGRKGYISRKRAVSEKERLRAQEAANSFTSVFPYIVMRMMATHVQRPYMRIPCKFSRQHLPRNKSNLVLRNTNGRSWTANYVPGPRCQVSGGWLAFARANRLEEGDYCAFEVVGPIELCVHIIRLVNDETPTAAMIPEK